MVGIDGHFQFSELARIFQGLSYHSVSGAFLNSPKCSQLHGNLSRLSVRRPRLPATFTFIYPIARTNRIENAVLRLPIFAIRQFGSRRNEIRSHHATVGRLGTARPHRHVAPRVLDLVLNMAQPRPGARRPTALAGTEGTIFAALQPFGRASVRLPVIKIANLLRVNGSRHD